MGRAKSASPQTGRRRFTLTPKPQTVAAVAAIAIIGALHLGEGHAPILRDKPPEVHPPEFTVYASTYLHGCEISTTAIGKEDSWSNL